MPIPPPELVARIGGTCDDYVDIGLSQRRTLERLLPADWSFEGKSVLDFGCGTGRTLAAFLDDAEQTEFFGCDIHAESIAWANSEMSPPLQFFVCEEAPPLAQPDQRFDLVYGMSVFTHITDEWSRWLVELHRVLRPGGLAVLSVLGPVVAQELLGIDWDDRIGMALVDLDKGWEIGGPSVLLGEWWVREHWGRAFEILRFEPCDPSFRQDFVVMRRRDGAVSAEALAAVDPGDQREYAAILCNIEMLERQQQRLGDRLAEANRARIAAELDCQQRLDSDRDIAIQLATAEEELSRRQAEVERLRGVLRVVTSSNSWRLTGQLRRARTLAGRARRRSRPGARAD